jgi:glycerol-3-phosphate cytidylyltransferase-like family protein
MKRNFMNQPLSRPLTPREKRIRSRWALAFVIVTLIAIWLVVKIANVQDDLEKTEANNSRLQTEIVKGENRIDSLYEEYSEAGIIMQTNSRYEQVITTLYVDDVSHKMMNEDKGFASKFSKSHRVDIVNRIKEIEKQNQYPVCSWIVAIELFRKENKIAAEEIDEFVGHLTE